MGPGWQGKQGIWFTDVYESFFLRRASGLLFNTQVGRDVLGLMLYIRFSFSRGGMQAQ